MAWAMHTISRPLVPAQALRLRADYLHIGQGLSVTYRAQVKAACYLLKPLDTSFHLPASAGLYAEEHTRTQSRLALHGNAAGVCGSLWPEATACRAAKVSESETRVLIQRVINTAHTGPILHESDNY